MQVLCFAGVLSVGKAPRFRGREGLRRSLWLHLFCRSLRARGSGMYDTDLET
ncbi:hypothetical protein M758_6G169300 [Ceratodon purpureus]|nr:hypothetical protein M758_6G169300 [Ceratodon purpureus]